MGIEIDKLGNVSKNGEIKIANEQKQQKQTCNNNNNGSRSRKNNERGYKSDTHI